MIAAPKSSLSRIMCPPADDQPWPTLGPHVVDFIEAELCHGPGDLLGQPVSLSDELQAWIYRMYEVEPPVLESRKGRVISRSKNPRAGRRRFRRCALSLRKGSTKTEIAAWIAAAELHPDGPVRCGGWESVRGVQQPVPVPVTDPYIPMIAYTEEQTEELAYGALRRILEQVPAGADFDIGLSRIMRLRGDGRAEAVSASPNARDGARTTFQHADETHRLVLEKLKKAWTVMLNNLAKRPLADPWALETTTAPEPGAGSVAEQTMEYALEVLEKGRSDQAKLFFFHRQASDKWDLDSEEERREAVIEASGPYVAEWSDIGRISESYNEPDNDKAYWRRVWLNQLVQSSGRAFNLEQWRKLARRGFVPADGAAISLGFQGHRFDGSPALIATDVETGHQWPLGIWQKPSNQREWDPAEEIDLIVTAAFERWHVCKLYGDPPSWEGLIAEWVGRYGKERVHEWFAIRPKHMSYAVRSFTGAITAEEMSHSGDPLFEKHIANAHKQNTNLVDDEDRPLWTLRKERADSPDEISAVKAAVLSWEARNDAIATGEWQAPEYEIHFIGAP
jgi:hypothetical protein